MNRRLAGTFDPAGRRDPPRLRAVLSDTLATTVERPPLSVTFSGGPIPRSEPLCLLDGWIDNAAELSEALGMTTGSDGSSPEVLLAKGWRRWRHELLSRLRGDFALLIWDQQRGEGMLARDRAGGAFAVSLRVGRTAVFRR